MKPTLYHYWRSSCSWRVRWALEIKQIPYDRVAINLLKGDHQAVDYRKKNPAQYVPTLAVDGRFYGESMAIIEYLEETHPTPSLLPSAPVDRLAVRQLADTIASGTQPLQNLSAQKYFSSDPNTRARYARHWIGRGLATYTEILRSHSCAGTYSFGGEITIADLALVPQVYNAIRFGVHLHPFAEIERIYQNCLNTEACAKAHPDRYQDNRGA